MTSPSTRTSASPFSLSALCILPGLEKYDTAGKLTGLRAALPTRGDTPLNKVAQDIPGHLGKPIHLLIPGFDYDHNRATFFRSDPANRHGWGNGEETTATLAECIHASSNAPIRYFDKPAELLHNRVNAIGTAQSLARTIPY